MKKIYILLMALFVSGVAFTQYTSKYNAINGIETKQKINVAPLNQNNEKDAMVTFFSEDFEGGDLAAAGWTAIDNDGDTYGWDFNCSFTAHAGSCCMASASWNSTVGPLTPDNYAITPAIDLSSATGTVFLEWFAAAQDQTWPSEFYEVRLSTTGTAVGDFTNLLYSETVAAGGPEPGNYWQRSVDISAYAGGVVYIAFVHTNCTDMYYLNIDDVSVYENTTVDGAITDIVAPNNSAGCALSASESVTITIFNNGGTPLTGFDATYSINGGTPVTETVTATIAPATSYDFTFATTADFSALGYYTVNANISVTGDVDASNDNLGTSVTSGDAYIEVIVSSDAAGGQSWEIYNSTNTLIASHGAYQWNLTNDLTTVCLLDNDCYTFYWYGGTTNDVTVTYNGVTVDATTATGDWTVFGIGGNCPAVDAKLVSLGMPAYALPNTNVDITGTVQNVGTDPITSYDVNYTVDGGTPVGVFSVTGVNITTGQTHVFTHNVPFNTAVEATYNIEVTISNVNGGTDANTTDNVLAQNLLITSSMMQRMVLFEVFSTEQCPNCPPVDTYIYNYSLNEPNMAVMAHHSGYYTDFLTIPESESPGIMDFYNDGGATYAPAGMSDRFYNGQDNDGDGNPEPGPVFWCGDPYGGNSIATRVAEPAFVSVNIGGTYNTTTHQLDATVYGDFITDFTGTIGVSLWITEDNIPESANPGQAGATGPWTHHDAVRDAISGVWGDQLSTPTTAGSSYSVPYTYNVDATWDYNNLYLVGFVNQINNADVNDREVHNVFKVKLTDIQPLANNKVIYDNNIQIYPNPTTGKLNVLNVENATIEVFNIVGEKVVSINNSNSIEQIDLSDFNNGTYIVRVLTKESVLTTKVVLDK